MSPSDKHLAETIHTLNFASKSRQIINNPVVNELPRIESKLKRPSPLANYPPITASHNQNKENENLHQRIAALEAKLANVSDGFNNDDRTNIAADSPLKPLKKKKQKIISEDDRHLKKFQNKTINFHGDNIYHSRREKEIFSDDDGAVAILWTSIQENIRNGMISDDQIDSYILTLVNSGSSSLIKKLPGIGIKRAQVVVEGRMMQGLYLSISDLEKRCDFKIKLINSMRQALIVQALYGNNTNRSSLELGSTIGEHNPLLCLHFEEGKKLNLNL